MEHILFRDLDLWVEYNYCAALPCLDIWFGSNPEQMDEEGDIFFWHAAYFPDDREPVVFERWYEDDTTLETSFTPAEKAFLLAVIQTQFDIMKGNRP